jgi:tetratricopeptide (TPR) repeat protein
MPKPSKRTKRNEKLRRQAKPRQQPRGTAPQVSVQQAIQLAAQHHTAGNLPQAEQIYQQILKSNPNQPVALHLLGVLAYQVGKYAESEALVSRSISVKPDFAESHNSLGATLQALGRFDEAVASYERAIALKPDLANAYSNLSVPLHRLGRLEEAAASCRKALAIKSNFPDAHFNLGIALQALGQQGAALASYERAIVLKPNHVDALGNMGCVLQELGRWEDATVLFDRTLAIRPDHAKSHNNKGNSLVELGRFDEAVVSYEKALAIDANNVAARCNLGNALQELGRLEESVASYHLALSIEPNHANAHSNLGHLYEKSNRLEEAETHVRKALEIEPSHHGASVTLAVLLRRRKDNDHAVEILEALPLEQLRGNHATRAHFELGKLYDLARDSDRAFQHFARGNQLQIQRSGVRIDANEYKILVEHTSRELIPDFAQKWRTETAASEIDSPVFLVGFPRSGTTLLDQILDGHPRMQVMEEQPPIGDLVAYAHSSLGGFPSALASLSDSDIRSLREDYYRRVDQCFCRDDKAMLVDKHPLNIAYIPMVTRLFPTARIILALRHPADVVLSNFMQYYQLNAAMANFHTIEDAAELYHRVMSLWLQWTRLFPLNVHIVKYEDLVADLESEARSLIQFLELDWNNVVLDFQAHARQRGKINTPSYEQVVQPIYQQAKYRWQRYERHLRPVLPVLQPFIEAFGYDE